MKRKNRAIFWSPQMLHESPIMDALFDRIIRLTLVEKIVYGALAILIAILIAIFVVVSFLAACFWSMVWTFEFIESWPWPA